MSLPTPVLILQLPFNVSVVVRRVRKTTKIDYYLRYVRPPVHSSVFPHGTTRLQLDGFSLNFIFENFSKISREKSCFIKI